MPFSVTVRAVAVFAYQGLELVHVLMPLFWRSAVLVRKISVSGMVDDVPVCSTGNEVTSTWLQHAIPFFRLLSSLRWHEAVHRMHV